MPGDGIRAVVIARHKNRWCALADRRWQDRALDISENRICVFAPLFRKTSQIKAYPLTDKRLGRIKIAKRATAVVKGIEA
jgi:hypothetical protein